MDSKNNRKVIKFGMFSPLTGKYLNSDEVCKEEKITFEDSIENKILESGVNLQIIQEFVNEGIDIFNMSSPFYNDICFQYNSKKDIALRDRVFEYFPNITLCEDGCDLLGINMTTITSICECFYSESKREENLKEKFLEETQISFIEDIITSSNIYVLKCIYLLFKGKKINKCYGGFIILCFFVIEIICSIFYGQKNIYSINKYLFGLTNKYINYLLQSNQNNTNNNPKTKNYKKLTLIDSSNKNNSPPKHKLKNSFGKQESDENKIIRKTKIERKTEINGNFNLIINNNKNMKVKNNYDVNKPDELYPNNIEKTKTFSSLSALKSKNQSNLSRLSAKHLFSLHKYEVPNENNTLFENIKYDLDINMDEYLETQYDDMDYDEAIRKDHRKFGECFMDKLRDNQIIINTFCSDETIKPKSIKITFLIFPI